MPNPHPTSTTTITPSLADTLAHLVKMPTLSTDHATNRAALDWVEEQLHGLPLRIQRFEHNGSPSLVATTPAVHDPKNPKLWLAAHLDVVPGEPDQFKPKVHNGQLHGRGVADMKFATAVYIRLLQELGADLAHYDLGLMLVTDEETGGRSTGWLVEQGYRGQAVLLPDNGASWELEIGSKGASFWKISSHGRAAHGSRTWNGVNAIDQLNHFLDIVRAHATTPEPCGSAHHMHHTFNLGSFNAGTGIANQVPEYAEALIDIRIAPGTTTDDVQGWIKEAQAQFTGINVEPIMSIEPFSVPNDGPVNRFAELAAEVSGRAHIPRILSPAGSDAHFFADHHIPVINLRPTGGDTHGPAEWIDLADLDRYYELTREFVTEWCQ